MIRKSEVALAICLAFAVGACTAKPTDSQTPPQPEYRPSFGDLMTMAVQPRHIKLGVSGHARNWSYAAYEASELRNAFNRIGRTIPTFKKQSVPDLFAANILPSLDKVDAAITAKDGAAFDAAYKNVTASCNACHVSLDHADVVIHEPSGSPYMDQDLTSGQPAAAN